MTSTEDDHSNIIIVSADRHLNLRLLYSNFRKDLCLDNVKREFIVNVLDRLGEESAKAQGLQIPITTATKFTTNLCDDLIYIIFHAMEGPVDLFNLKELGFIRFGTRDLYVADDSALKHLKHCPSILDFYIRPKRLGFGKILFDVLLEELNLMPQTMAYDRPSDSMVAFLKKHFSLDKPRWQHNHYVIFDSILAN